MSTFRTASSDEDRLFAAMICIAHCPIEVILTFSDEFGELLQSLNAENWEWFSNRTRHFVWFSRLATTKNLKRSSFPSVMKPRMACTLAEVSIGGLRKEIVNRYLVDISDPITDKYRMWLAADLLKFGKKDWSPDLEKIKDLFKGNVDLLDDGEIIYRRDHHSLKKIQMSVARKILESPRDFPPQLVSMSERSMRHYMAMQNRSLGSAIRQLGWFKDLPQH